MTCNPVTSPGSCTRETDGYDILLVNSAVQFTFSFLLQLNMSFFKEEKVDHNEEALCPVLLLLLSSNCKGNTNHDLLSQYQAEEEERDYLQSRYRQTSCQFILNLNRPSET